MPEPSGLFHGTRVLPTHRPFFSWCCLVTTWQRHFHLHDNNQCPGKLLLKLVERLFDKTVKPLSKASSTGCSGGALEAQESRCVQFQQPRNVTQSQSHCGAGRAPQMWQESPAAAPRLLGARTRAIVRSFRYQSQIRIFSEHF